LGRFSSNLILEVAEQRRRRRGRGGGFMPVACLLVIFTSFIHFIRQHQNLAFTN
jgi:hypothetical protein